MGTLMASEQVLFEVMMTDLRRNLPPSMSRETFSAMNCESQCVHCVNAIGGTTPEAAIEGWRQRFWEGLGDHRPDWIFWHKSPRMEWRVSENPSPGFWMVSGRFYFPIQRPLKNVRGEV